MTSPWLPSVDLPIDLTEATENALADSVSAVVRDDFGSLEVEQRVIHGAAGQVLIAQAAHSDLVVVGSRGLGGFKGLLLGSVSHQVVTHAPCVVVVVPHGARTAPSSSVGAPMLVGVDGSANSIAALRWAAGRARATGTTIRAILVWRPPGTMTPASISMEPSPTDIARHDASTMLDEYVAEAALPGNVQVERVAIEGMPAKMLIDEGRHAELLVVGARGHEGFAGLLLGSVTTAVVRHAPCPVAVIPQP